VELWRFISSKSVDYTGAVMGSSRPGVYRRFRCPEWMANQKGGNGRRVYWGESKVKYDSSWEALCVGSVVGREGGEEDEGGKCGWKWRWRWERKDRRCSDCSICEGEPVNARVCGEVSERVLGKDVNEVNEGSEGGEVRECGSNASLVREVDDDAESYVGVLREWDEWEGNGRCVEEWWWDCGWYW
jgi:hypothetical protein